MEIYYIDRKTGEKKRETVAGDKYLRWMYETKTGTNLLEAIIKRKLFSTIYGKIQDLSLSRRKISDFIKNLEIDMTEAEYEDLKHYKNFNDFFTRRLKKNSRPICQEKDSFISPGDGRIFAYENINVEKILQVKGQQYPLWKLIEDRGLAEEYAGGTCIVVRLNPADYHRFHFPDDGIPDSSIKITGAYYSVNPIALRKRTGIYCENKREITIFQSKNFEEIVMIEVGATCVGTIIQTYQPGKTVKKGEEKGYFKFGGSTVILFLKKNRIKIDEDIINNTNQGFETKVKMGEKIGVKI
ncbi:phosphatidylserine decarboxylase [Natronincola ferrireducens]|uniref:Phosphatidylserine decarboxylase proenzyme n=1 Tax=Natronincola ferrireducens TaxID=393762 RepID=A0A1G9G2M0_9FIRM|nr:phosphatidylserine decarboxylase [Natronincola ferrireducens]SDK94891.1 phosphatidylserine decarboxylase [Natronincola ferrireducens]